MHHVELQIVWILYRRRERTLRVTRQNPCPCRMRDVAAVSSCKSHGRHDGLPHASDDSCRPLVVSRGGGPLQMRESKARQEHGIGAARLLPRTCGRFRNHRTRIDGHV